ncbi:Aldehyde dehydrogenase [Clostridiaceae bacterium JG1575]|nr:Aldehyde dehydrogenase [Clostridiaceae bacterium JG1575]
MKQYDQLYINGKWRASDGTQWVEGTNPATLEPIGKMVCATPEEIDEAVSAAHKAFPEWNARPLEERAAFLAAIADGIERHQEELAKLIVEELGAPITFARGVQVGGSIREIRATLEELPRFFFKEELENVTVLKEGFGVVACITPWNYPLNQIQRKITPAFLAGNTVVVKPASLTPRTALALAQIIHETKLPEGVFNLILGSGAETGKALAAHPKVRLISFTGSTKAGQSLYAQAALGIKKLILELGGKSALILLPEGEETQAVSRCMETILNNSGQSCSALTRLLVPREKRQAVEALLLDYVQRVGLMGDPLDPATKLGPVVSKDQYERVLNYIEKGKGEGARVLTGGTPRQGAGYFIPTTIFSDVTPQMTIAQEEIFGPVLCVMAYDTVEEAIEWANDTPYGLSGAVVGPEEEAYKVALRLRTGNVYLNAGKANPKAPFGGYHQSGLGREMGLYGLEDYLEIKAILK